MKMQKGLWPGLRQRYLQTDINAELSLYELKKEDETGVLSRRLVLKDSAVLDFRYKVQRKDEVTAVKEIGEDG